MNDILGYGSIGVYFIEDEEGSALAVNQDHYEALI